CMYPMVRSINACISWFFFSSRRRHTRFSRDWSSDVCSSDLSDDGEFEARLAGDEVDDLVAEALGVAVGVGPAPVARALHAGADQRVGQPHPALAHGAGAQGLVVEFVAPFLAQPARGARAKLGEERAVVGLLLDARDRGAAV